MSGLTPEARLIELEMLYTHLARDFNDVNEVVIAQGKSLRALERLCRRLEARLETLDSALEERAHSESATEKPEGNAPAASLGDEVPPHH